MTAEQILGIAQTATDMLTQTQAPAAPPPPTPSFDIADDEYMTGAQYKQAMAAQRAQPVDDTAVRMAADANLSIVRSQYANDFAKYGSEINTLLAQVPTNLRTLDNIQRVVKMVRSDHVDEIAAERAQQLASTMASTLRPTGGAGATASVSRDASLEYDKIPAEWRERARAAKITEETVREFCQANGMTPAQFYKQFDTPMNKIVEDVSVRKQA